MECQCQLQSFGILPANFPVSPEGKYRKEFHQQWLHHRQELEASRCPWTTCQEIPVDPFALSQDVVASTNSNSLTTHTEIVDPFATLTNRAGVSSTTKKCQPDDSNNYNTTPRNMPVPLLQFSPALSIATPLGQEGRFDRSKGISSLSNTSSNSGDLDHRVMEVRFPPTPLTTMESSVSQNVMSLQPKSSLSSRSALALPIDCAASLASNCSDCILQPGPQDILFGRGKPYQERPSNVWFRNLLESYRNRYEVACKSEKTKLATEIVHVVKLKNGRFLKQSQEWDYWVEVDDKMAREKVSHAFRTRRSKTKGSEHLHRFGMNTS